MRSDPSGNTALHRNPNQKVSQTGVKIKDEESSTRFPKGPSISEQHGAAPPSPTTTQRVMQKYCECHEPSGKGDREALTIFRWQSKPLVRSDCSSDSLLENAAASGTPPPLVYRGPRSPGLVSFQRLKGHSGSEFFGRRPVDPASSRARRCSVGRLGTLIRPTDHLRSGGGLVPQPNSYGACVGLLFQTAPNPPPPPPLSRCSQLAPPPPPLSSDSQPPPPPSLPSYPQLAPPPPPLSSDSQPPLPPSLPSYPQLAPPPPPLSSNSQSPPPPSLPSYPQLAPPPPPLSSNSQSPPPPSLPSYPQLAPPPPPLLNYSQPPSAPPPLCSDMASPVSAHTRSRSAPSARSSLLCPLRKVAGAEGVVRVHVPFSLTDLSTIEKRLGSFSADPTTYIKEFRYLTQAYDLTWHDTYVILSSTLTPDERNRILGAARAHADQSAPDIRKKLKKAEEGPQTPIRDLVNMAFKVLIAERKRLRPSARPIYSNR
ncbi:WAS/WASL-interacting protein family member 2-like [Aotus nancymaae]|uniref:WAS/WASL-interacting protein family member 2-like n=1 Tax=Aotus nancymaae TaxID=37293 RepID=UPI0030FEC200